MSTKLQNKIQINYKRSTCQVKKKSKEIKQKSTSSKTKKGDRQARTTMHQSLYFIFFFTSFVLTTMVYNNKQAYYNLNRCF